MGGGCLISQKCCSCGRLQSTYNRLPPAPMGTPCAARTAARRAAERRGEGPGPGEEGHIDHPGPWHPYAPTRATSIRSCCLKGLRQGLALSRCPAWRAFEHDEGEGVVRRLDIFDGVAVVTLTSGGTRKASARAATRGEADDESTTLAPMPPDFLSLSGRPIGVGTPSPRKHGRRYKGRKRCHAPSARREEG